MSTQLARSRAALQAFFKLRKRRCSAPGIMPRRSQVSVQLLFTTSKALIDSLTTLGPCHGAGNINFERPAGMDGKCN